MKKTKSNNLNESSLLENQTETASSSSPIKESTNDQFEFVDNNDQTLNENKTTPHISKILLGVTSLILIVFLLIITLYFIKPDSTIFSLVNREKETETLSVVDKAEDNSKYTQVSNSENDELIKPEKTELEEIKKIPLKDLDQPSLIEDTTENTDKILAGNHPTDGFKYIALTFDDGPYDAVDERILDLLDDFDGRATFFVLGDRVEIFPQTMKRIVEQGSEIGNHSFYHPDLTSLSSEEILNEINSTSEIVKDTTGYEISIYRPTYGMYNDHVLTTIPMPSILWNIDTRDWHTKNSQSIREELLFAGPGSIVLMHSLYPETAEALEQTLPELYQEGYRFVTVSELFEKYGVELQNHTAYSKANMDD